MRVLIAGSGRLGVSVMEPLLDSEHEVVGLLQNDRTGTRTSRLQAMLTPPSVSTHSLALRRSLPVFWIDRMNNADLDPVRMLDPDLIITCGFGIIFKKSLLDLPNIGCVNVHSSLLPKHRGPSPFGQVILANEAQSGVTFHVMDEDIDTGDILEQASFPITPIDSGLTVYQKACDLTRECILNLVDTIEAQGLSGTPQDPARSTYDARMTHETALIDWRDDAETIERLVRAAVAYYPAWFTHHGRIVRVTRATFDPRIVDATPGTVLETAPYPIVATGSGRLIIHAAHLTAPIPWSWPAPWARLKSADLLY